MEPELNCGQEGNSPTCSGNGSQRSSSLLLPSGRCTIGNNSPDHDFDIKKAFAQMQAQMKALSEKVGLASQPLEVEKYHQADTFSEENFPGNTVLEISDDPQENPGGQDIDEELQTFLDAPMASVVDLTIPPDSISQGEQLFDFLVSDLDYETTAGPKISEKLASVVANICTIKLQPAKLKEKCDKYKRPENVELLQTTQVNKLIWDNLQLATRTRDIKLQKVQMIIVKAMSAITTLVNDCMISKAGLEKQNILAKATDALALLGSANIDFNLFRRELIKPELNSEYKNLCDKSTPVSKFLFGDNVSQQLRDINDANKLSKKCMFPIRGRTRGQGRGKFRTQRGSYQSRRYQPFLGQWKPSQNKGQPKQKNQRS